VHLAGFAIEILLSFSMLSVMTRQFFKLNEIDIDQIFSLKVYNFCFKCPFLGIEPSISFFKAMINLGLKQKNTILKTS